MQIPETCRLSDQTPGVLKIGSAWVLTQEKWTLPEPPHPLDKTVVGELWRWPTSNCLSPQAQSDLGFDPFLYHLAEKPVPTFHMFTALARRLYKESFTDPTSLYYAVFFEQLKEYLGSTFAWVEVPRTKHLAWKQSRVY